MPDDKHEDQGEPIPVKPEEVVVSPPEESTPETLPPEEDTVRAAFTEGTASGEKAPEGEVALEPQPVPAPPPANAPTDVLTSTRGFRNNNPGNLRYSDANPWLGQLDPDDAGFCRFTTPVAGIRALARTLVNYENDHGLNTLDGIVHRWAPPGDHNDTAAYLSSVCRQTGYADSAVLQLRDGRVLTPLVVAIIRQENGSQPYDEATVAAGVSQALGHS